MKKDWRKQHWEELKQLAGNWIGIDKESGVILESDKSLLALVERVKRLNREYVLHYVNPYDVYEPRVARF